MSASKLSLSSLDDEDFKTGEPQSMHVDMSTLQSKTALSARMEGSRAEIVMLSVRMKKSERRRLKEICNQQEISAQDLVFQAVNLWCKSRGVRGLD